MDLLALGLNSIVVGGIIAITKVITTVFDPQGKLSRWYILVPTVLAVLGAYLMTTPFEVKAFLLNVLIYAGVSTYLFKFGKSVILGD